MDIKDKILSAPVASFLEKLYLLNSNCFSIDTAYNLLSNSPKESVRRMLSNMVKRGIIMRVKDGIYYLIPFEQDAKSFMPDWHHLAQYIVGDSNYYIGYYSALQLLDLTTQPALNEQIVVSKQIKPAVLKIKGVTFQFIYHNEKHFFGIKKTWINSFDKVNCSDLEKTIIDCLFKPNYAGGITEITKAVYQKKDKLDFEKLYQYALLFDSQAVIKRLGFLLELLEIKFPQIEKLQKIRTNSIALLEPIYPKTGKTISRWSLNQNIDTDSILSPIYS